MTTTPPHSILLIPADGDPHGLLKEGPCDSRPPMALEYTCATKLVWHPAPHDRFAMGRVATGRRALVLAREGKPVAAGLMLVLLEMDTMGDVKEACRDLLNGAPTDAAEGARRVWGSLGTFVFLDANDQEV